MPDEITLAAEQRASQDYAAQLIFGRQFEEQKTELTAARARIAKLEAALRSIDNADWPIHPNMIARTMRVIAREALKP